MVKKIVIPCSGIGKAFGTVAREATYLLTDSEYSDEYNTICLPLLMTDDEGSKKAILESDVYTIDGCTKRCASVLVKHVGRNPVLEILAAKVLAKNREHKPGTILDIGDGGQLLAKDIMKIIHDHGGNK